MIKLSFITSTLLAMLIFVCSANAQSNTSSEYVVRKKNSARVNGCGPDGSSKTTTTILNSALDEKSCNSHDTKYGTSGYSKSKADKELANDIYNNSSGTATQRAAKSSATYLMMQTSKSQTSYDNAQKRANYESKSTKEMEQNANYQKKQCTDTKNYYVREKTKEEKEHNFEYSEY